MGSGCSLGETSAFVAEAGCCCVVTPPSPTGADDVAAVEIAIVVAGFGVPRPENKLADVAGVAKPNESPADVAAGADVGAPKLRPENKN